MKCKQNEEKNDEKTQPSIEKTLNSIVKDAMRKRLAEKKNEMEQAELDKQIKIKEKQMKGEEKNKAEKV